MIYHESLLAHQLAENIRQSQISVRITPETQCVIGGHACIDVM